MELRARELWCPEGREQFAADDILWLDSAGNPGEGLPPVQGRWARAWTRLVGLREGSSRRELTELDRIALLQGGYQPHCPAGHELPPEFAERPTIVIGLVGERGAGKSHYIAVLVEMLCRGALAPYRLSAGLAPSCQATYLQSYHHFLFGATAGAGGRHDEGRPRPVPLTANAESTDVVRKPITVALRHDDTRRSVNVVFYDASGEQMATAQEQAAYNKFLLGADALLLFVTPSSLPLLRPEIPPSGDIGGQSLPASQGMFDALASALRAVRGVPDDDDLDGVDALVLLNKADQVVQVDGFDPAWLTEIDDETGDVEAVRRRIADETPGICEFIERNGGLNLTHSLTGRFAGLTFHCVSPTGCSVDETGHYAAVSPMRVVEPLLELLARHGMVA